MAQQQFGGGEALRAVGVEAVEGAGLDEVFELPPVEALGVEPAGEVEEVLEGAVALALGDESLPSPARRHP